jgi:hypothetical protein
MSKLFGLKEWLTLPEAARRLTDTFKEQVTDADVLRFALDGRLKLSVLFANFTTARYGKVTPIEDASYREFILGGKKTVREYSGPVFYTNGKESHALNLAEGVVQVSGVYDLPMIGNEVVDVENKFRQLSSIPKIEYSGRDNFYIQGKEDMTLAMLMECVFGDGDEDAIERLQRLGDVPKIDDYYPASTMPTDSIFVVRALLLKEFEDSINPAAATEETPNQRMERIGAYVDKTHAAGGTKEDAYRALAKIDGCGIEAIKNVYKRYRKQ